MRCILTKEWLESEGACAKGIAWWEAHGSPDVAETLRRLSDQPDYATWLIRRTFDKAKSLTLAIYCAELCRGRYNGPNGWALDAAIAAAKAVLDDDNPKTQATVYAAADAARAAAYATGAARAAVWDGILEEAARIWEAAK